MHCQIANFGYVHLTCASTWFLAVLFCAFGHYILGPLQDLDELCWYVRLIEMGFVWLCIGRVWNPSDACLDQYVIDGPPLR